ncbi:MAG TPA: M48 family metalloprotease [Terriglobia bacterium]|nr:M48 family metalloprotease [Terriglobia bacterium]
MNVRPKWLSRVPLWAALVAAAILEPWLAGTPNSAVSIIAALAAPAPPAEGRQTTQLKQGQTPDEVKKIAGKPDAESSFGESLIYTYPSFQAIFKTGRLAAVKERSSLARSASSQAGALPAPTQQRQGKFFAGLKAISGQGKPQEVTTATAGSKSVGEGRRIAEVTPTAADWQAVSRMETGTVSQADLAAFRAEGRLEAQARSTPPEVENKTGVSTAASQADQVSDIGSGLGGRFSGVGGFFRRAKKQTQKAHQATAPFTVQEEQEIGREVAVKFVAYYHVYKDDDLTHYVSLVGADVAAQQERQDISYHFAVLDSEDINAFSAPGGYVFVTRGALALCQDESELAGVLAHEVGHVAGKHVLNVLERDKTLRAGENEAASHAPDSAYLNKLSDAVLVKVIDQGLAPADEFNADQRGVTYAYTAGYPAKGLERFLERLDQATNQGAKSFWTRTHPPVDQRNQRIEQLIAAQRWTDANRPEMADRFAVATADHSGNWMVPVSAAMAERVPTPSGEAAVTDNTIVSDLNGALWQDTTLKTLDIRVSSEGGVVTLTGKVNTRLEKAAVERLAQGEKGVLQVVDHLTVSPPPR